MGSETVSGRAQAVLRVLPPPYSPAKTCLFPFTEGTPSLCPSLSAPQHQGGITGIRQTTPRNEIEQHKQSIWAAAGARDAKLMSLISYLVISSHTRMELGREAEVVLAIQCVQRSAIGWWQSRPVFQGSCQLMSSLPVSSRAWLCPGGLHTAFLSVPPSQKSSSHTMCFHDSPWRQGSWCPSSGHPGRGLLGSPNLVSKQKTELRDVVGYRGFCPSDGPAPAPLQQTRNFHSTRAF